MALRNENIFALLLTYSASHRARLLGFPQPTNRIALWTRDVFPRVRKFLAENGPHHSPSNDDFAVAIMLASLEIVSPNAFNINIPWQHHFHLARKMYKLRSAALNRDKLLQADETREQAFLNHWFYRIEIMNMLSEPEMSKSLNPESASPWEYQIIIEDNYEKQDCLCHVTKELMDTLSKTAELIRRYEAVEESIWSNSEKFKEGSSCRHPMIHHPLNIAIGWWEFDSLSALSEGFKGRVMQNLYRWAAIILPYRRVGGRPISDTAVQHYVREIFEAVELAGFKGVNLSILFHFSSLVVKHGQLFRGSFFLVGLRNWKS